MINVRCNSYGVRVHFEVHSRSIYIYLFYPIAMEGKEKKNEVSFSNSSVFNKWMLDVVWCAISDCAPIEFVLVLRVELSIVSRLFLSFSSNLYIDLCSRRIPWVKVQREFIIRLYNKVHNYNSRQVNKYSKKNHHEKSRIRSGCNLSTIASIEHTIVNLTIIRIERRNDILTFFGFVPIRRRSKLLPYSFSSRFPMRLLNRKNTSKTC